jgi:transcriptional regulator with XRE-family HTH domain
MRALMVCKCAGWCRTIPAALSDVSDIRTEYRSANIYQAIRVGLYFFTYGRACVSLWTARPKRTPSNRRQQTRGKLNLKDRATQTHTTLAERVRTRRKAMELTQDQLAERAGVKQSTVSLVESGVTLWLKGSTLLRMASALGVTPDWLNTGRGELATGASSTDARESELLDLFRALPSASQSALLSAARAIGAAHESPKVALPRGKGNKRSDSKAARAH